MEDHLQLERGTNCQKVVLFYKEEISPDSYDCYEGKPQRILGLLSGKATFSLPADFKISDDDFYFIFPDTPDMNRV